MKTAADVMNRNFFRASPRDDISALLQEMAERGVGAVPVLDGKGRPLGVATTAEIERSYDMDELVECLARPAVCLDQTAPLEAAARALARHPSCCLILVDAGGVAVGALSPIELLRAVVGCEGTPESLQRQGRDGDWERADLLELGAAHRAPAAPGIILLSPGFDGSKKRVVWAESALDMRERLDQMLREPQDDEGLEAMLEVYPRTVRFRCLTMHDKARRDELADALCNVTRRSRSARRARPRPEPVRTNGESAHAASS